MRGRRTRAALLAVLALTPLIGCDIREDWEHRKRLEALVQRSATREEIARELGEGYTLYEKDTPRWEDLERSLQQQHPGRLESVRENVKRYPKVMFYTTMWRMTWIFLDDKDVIRTYILAAQ